MSKKSNQFSPEVRERAVRMVLDHRSAPGYISSDGSTTEHLRALIDSVMSGDGSLVVAVTCPYQADDRCSKSIYSACAFGGLCTAARIERHPSNIGRLVARLVDLRETF